MKTLSLTRQVFTIPSREFQPLPLCLDDVLPVSMVLLMGFRHGLDPVLLRSALEKALTAFPHLTGRLHFSLQPLQAALVPAQVAVELEWIREGEGELAALETWSQDALFDHFAPSAAAAARSPLGALSAPLLQLRLTQLEGGKACVLGVMASHMALDGVGLSLFLTHVTAALRGHAAPEVIHDRRCTFPEAEPGHAVLPPHYGEIAQISLAMAQSDLLAASPATVFSVPVDGCARLAGNASANEARLDLAASLCRSVAVLQPGRSTVALWCNTRGLGPIPRHYTGNTGCYLHLNLTPDDPEGLRRALKGTVTRQSFAALLRDYTELKRAELAGRYAFWQGPGDNLLSLNLVPHAKGPADFGYGDPVYAQLLTRNVSGLRIYTTPDGARFVVEASLPAGHGDALAESCRELGLPVKVWHQGGI